MGRRFRLYSLKLSPYVECKSKARNVNCRGLIPYERPLSLRTCHGQGWEYRPRLYIFDTRILQSVQRYQIFCWGRPSSTFILLCGGGWCGMAINYVKIHSANIYIIILFSICYNYSQANYVLFWNKNPPQPGVPGRHQ